jgi:hypothetical protein
VGTFKRTEHLAVAARHAITGDVKLGSRPKSLFLRREKRGAIAAKRQNSGIVLEDYLSYSSTTESEWFIHKRSREIRVENGNFSCTHQFGNVAQARQAFSLLPVDVDNILDGEIVALCLRLHLQIGVQ